MPRQINHKLRWKTEVYTNGRKVFTTNLNVRVRVRIMPWPWLEDQFRLDLIFLEGKGKNEIVLVTAGPFKTLGQAKGAVCKTLNIVSGQFMLAKQKADGITI